MWSSFPLSPITLAVYTLTNWTSQCLWGRKRVRMGWLLIWKNWFLVVEFEQPDRLVRGLFERPAYSYILLNHIYMIGLGSPLSGQEWQSTLQHSQNSGIGSALSTISPSIPHIFIEHQHGTSHCAKCFYTNHSFDLHCNLIVTIIVPTLQMMKQKPRGFKLLAQGYYE